MLIAALFALTIASAVRGLWSPCGLSMLSTITPVAERSRGHSYRRTVAWYVAGATLGGTCLGAVLAMGAVAVGALSAPPTSRTLVALAAVAICLASDLRVLGFRLPDHPRQVDERWVDRFRPWAYAGGYGWQIGTGVATYVMTSAVYGFVAIAVVALSPSAALAAGAAFGAVRGLSILAGTRATTPERVIALHRRLEQLAPWSVALAVGAQASVLVVLGASTRHVALAATAASFAIAALVLARAKGSRLKELVAT